MYEDAVVEALIRRRSRVLCLGIVLIHRDLESRNVYPINSKPPLKQLNILVYFSGGCLHFNRENQGFERDVQLHIIQTGVYDLSIARFQAIRPRDV